jgi:hypothetical protein
MKGNGSDASILYNMSFTIHDVETARVTSATFWSGHIYILKQIIFFFVTHSNLIIIISKCV